MPLNMLGSGDFGALRLANRLLRLGMDFQVPRESSRLILQNVAEFGHEQDSRVADPVDAAVLKEICQWFEQHGIAWSGTPGELAVGIGRPAQQVLHAIEAEFMALLVFGISASLSRRSGSPTLISLHRLEKIVTPAKDSTFERGAAPEQNCENSGHPPDIFPEVPAEDSEMPATVPVVDDAIWRNKLALAALSPTDDPPRRVIRKIFRIVLVGIILVAIIWATNRALKLGGGRIGSWLRSIASHSPGDPKGHTPAPNSDRRTPKSSLSAASAELSALQVQAKMGNATAQYALGLKLLQGDGIRPNEQGAVTWFRQAANAGNTNAQFQLGTAYMLGRGIPQDYVQAYTWLTLVAKSDTRAQAYLRELTPKLKEPEIARVRWNLAEMYRRGIGAHADKLMAYTWYVLAEAAGETRSAQAKVELASQMTARQVSEANAVALSWLRHHGVQTSTAASSDHLR